MTAKADRIKKLLENEDLIQGFDDVRNALIRNFAACKPSDVETMQDISKRLHLLESVWANLRTAIQEGKLLDFNKNQEDKLPPLGDIYGRSRKG